MKLTKPTATVDGKITDYKGLEKAVRVCYKSEDKITDGSAEKLLGNIIQRGHFSCLEHIRVILQIPAGFYHILKDLDHSDHPMIVDSRYIEKTHYNRYVISGNIRAFRDLYLAFEDVSEVRDICFKVQEIYPLLFDDIPMVCDTSSFFYEQVKQLEPEDLLDEEKIRHDWQTVRFAIDRGVSHELVRHRTMSFLQESTRYCDYSGEVEFIDIAQGSLLDSSIENRTEEQRCEFYNRWRAEMISAENAYHDLRKQGVSPQIARSVLPNSLKTEVIATAPMYVWRDFFRQRTAPVAHPQMREVAAPLYVDPVWDFIRG